MSMETDPLVEGLQVYQVGGSVRDALLGLPSGDRDFVVVGASPEAMLARGFRPVGKDFPVFLHPHTQEEYALARTERKTAPGYHGFQFHTGPEVTLEDDLARRDLTINAMALDRDGGLIDPYHGRLDLQQKLLRHVSDAFAEDPVRVLRLARFATRFAAFSIADLTLGLCQRMVAQGELAHLVPERVWQELARALMHEAPSRFFSVLQDCGALAVVMPELADGAHDLRALDQAARLDADVAVRFAALVHRLAANSDHNPSDLEVFCDRLRVPNDCRHLASLVGAEQPAVCAALSLSADQLLALLEALDCFRRPERLAQVVLACQAIDQAKHGRGSGVWPPGAWLERAFAAAAAVRAEGFVAQGLQGPAIAAAMRAARIDKVAALHRQ